jgi:hypothetical protein
MLKKAVLVAGLGLCSITTVFAQPTAQTTNAAPPPPHSPGAKPPPPPPPPAKGFELRMGPGQSLKVNCGDEPIKACINAAKPLLNRLEGKASGASSSGSQSSAD